MFPDIFKNSSSIGLLAFLGLCAAGFLLYMHHQKHKGNEIPEISVHYEGEGDTSGVVDHVVDIPDPNLRAAIAEALQKAPEETITRTEMETLAELRALGGVFGELQGSGGEWILDAEFGGFEAQGTAITDLCGLEFAINLKYLYLWSNNITDISPVVSLTHLRTLSLGINAISDISPLANRTTPLLMLELNGNKISDISALANLDVGMLSLAGNAISDISPLAGLTHLRSLHLQHNTISDISPLANLKNLQTLDLRHNTISDIQTLERLIEQGTVIYFSGNPIFQTPGTQIEDGWVWLIVPATNVNHGSDAAHSGRDFLKEVSDGAVKETDVAVKGATAETQFGNSVWTPAPLTAADPDNLNAIVNDYNLETDSDDPLVVYGVVSIQSKTPQQTRVYISGCTVQVWLNGTRVYRNSNYLKGIDYVTAVPVTLNAGENLLFINAYRDTINSRWGASFGFQDGTVYTTAK
ncbi:MAG: leucine-rich repeat domain-containing protein [Candidatus Poribacteria bacterium]|nr:leucine-rich repeat domain-containing protein [Candidatus Poribacteria bacterium]